MFKISTFIIIMMTFIPQTIWASSAASLVKKGRQAYSQGEFDKAVQAFEEAAVQMPESAEIYFNKGTCLYQLGDYNGAKEAFEKAALKTKNPALEAGALFNLGDTSFKQAERQQDSDLQKAMEGLQQAVEYFHQALKLNPKLKEAGENIEVARLLMKNILDQINKQKQEQEKQAQAQQKIKELIKKQEELYARTKENPDHPNNLLDDQKQLRDETSTLEQQLPAPQKTPSPADQARQHLQKAVVHQGGAIDNLNSADFTTTLENQQKAIDELKKSLGNQDQKKDQGGQCPPKKEQDQKQEQKQEQKKSEQKARAQKQDDAENIIDQEKKNMKKRQPVNAGGFQGVDRDW